MPDIIRAFIALGLPAEIKQELARVNRLLADGVSKRSVRWVQPEKMHLTLRFLGDTAIDRLPAISQALDEVAQSSSPFSLQLNQVGCFPNQKRPRVIWVDLQGADDGLQQLKRGIDEVLVPFGWDMETRPFKAHLTLGRVKDARQLASMRWDTRVEPLTFRITAVDLMESQLTPQGPIYTIRHQAKFI